MYVCQGPKPSQQCMHVKVLNQGENVGHVKVLNPYLQDYCSALFYCLSVTILHIWVKNYLLLGKWFIHLLLFSTYEDREKGEGGAEKRQIVKFSSPLCLTHN